MAANDETTLIAEDAEAPTYPPYVITAEDRRRWDLCLELAEAYFADLAPGERREQVWSATRVLYSSDTQTGEESERET